MKSKLTVKQEDAFNDMILKLNPPKCAIDAMKAKVLSLKMTPEQIYQNTQFVLETASMAKK